MGWNRLVRQIRHLPWMDQAACAGLPSDLFHPPTGDIVTAQQAKTICHTCPVELECRRYAIVEREQDGIWGGMSKKERARERVRMVATGEIMIPVGRTHGIAATYVDGCRCTTCRFGYAAYRRKQRERAQ